MEEEEEGLSGLIPQVGNEPFQFGSGQVDAPFQAFQFNNDMVNGPNPGERGPDLVFGQARSMQPPMFQAEALDASSSTEDPPIGGKSQDYMALARTYSMQVRFAASQLKSGERPLCVLCNKNNCSMVLFPCEHSCICAKCIEKEHFCALDSPLMTQGGCCSCPLCAGVIRKMLPYEGGNEVEKYWAWVHEINPLLPKGFMKNWRHSAAIIEKVRVVNNEPDNEGSRFCTIS